MEDKLLLCMGELYVNKSFMGTAHFCLFSLMVDDMTKNIIILKKMSVMHNMYHGV